MQFSRRYSFREIQDRWYSLLYDPIISAEASAGMTNFELSASPLPSRFVKFGHSKDRRIASAKRKAESVRTSYYAMRKRIGNHTFTSMDFGFLVDPENGNYVANGSETLPENCVAEGETSNHFGFHGSHVDPAHYAFPKNMMDGSVATNGVTTHTYYTGAEDPAEENFPAEPKNILKEEPQILGDDVSLNGVVEEMSVPKELAIDSFIEDDNLEKMPMSTFDHINSDPGNLCSEFDGNHVFESPDLECGTSFNSLHLSPLPEMWKTHESIQQPDMPCDDFKDSIPCGEGYLAELSNSLLNFTSDDELYLMDVDGKDGIDKSYYEGLSSLLLSSPNDVSPDQMPKKAETESSVASEAHVSNLSVSCPTKVDDNMGSHSSNAQTVHKLEFQLPSSASVKDPQFPELTNGVIFCTLNTEDPEVPSNDDVFLPFDVPPSTSPFSSKWTYTESNKPISSSVQDYGFSNHKANERGKMAKVEQKNPGESRVSSQMMGSPPFAGPVGSSKVKCEFPSTHTSRTVSRSAVTVSGGLGGNKSANTTNALMHANPKEEPTNVGLAKFLSNHVTNSLSEKPALGSNDFRNHPHPNGVGMKQEPDIAVPVQDHHLQHAEVGSSDIPESELVANPPTLDEEEQYIESDDDVPYYSDIEAMVRRVALAFQSTVSFTFFHNCSYFLTHSFKPPTGT